MKKFFKNIILFLLLALIVGEVVVRLTHAVSDIPQRTIDEHGIQKYFPNQNGYWKGGKHSWVINELGWPGELPKSYDNLIMVIGDSYIENFMNPNECHQAVYLKENMPDYNFMEAARSGVSLIEAMEIIKQFDSLKPVQTLIYVNDGDFYESVSEIKPMNDITQLDVKNKTVNYGEMKAPFLKKVLYNWKLMYYFYNRFYSDIMANGSDNNKVPIKKEKNDHLEYSVEINELMDFIKSNYPTEKLTLVFHPNSNTKIINICESKDFKTIVLDSTNDNSWSFEFDTHWTCYGHKQAAEQVSQNIQIDFINND